MNKLTVAALPLLFVVSVRAFAQTGGAEGASLETSFEAGRSLFQAADIGSWFSGWGKEPVPSREYTVEEADPRSRRIAVEGDSLFFIDGDRLFRKDLQSGEVKPVWKEKGIAALFRFKGTLFVHDRSSEYDALLAYDAQGRRWKTVAVGVDQVINTDDRLVLRRTGELWIMRERPEAQREGHRSGIAVNGAPVVGPMLGGQLATPSGPALAVPMGGKNVCTTCEHFYKTGVQSARSIERRERDGTLAIEVIFEDGRRADLSELDLSENR